MAAMQRKGSGQSASPPPARPVALHWLDGAPPLAESGVSWGVPWPRGVVRKDQNFTLTAANGRILPLETWTLAWWPDGSLKWTGHATVTDAPGPFRIAPSNSANAGYPAVEVRESASLIDVDTGNLQCRVPRQGS